MAADGKTPPTHPQGGGGNIMCTCSIFVCRHKNNDMSTLLGHAHTYIPTDRQTDTQAYIHKSIQTYSYTNTWLHMCDVSPLWGGWGGTRGGWIIYTLIHYFFLITCCSWFLHLSYLPFVLIIHFRRKIDTVWQKDREWPFFIQILLPSSKVFAGGKRAETDGNSEFVICIILCGSMK